MLYLLSISGNIKGVGIAFIIISIIIGFIIGAVAETRNNARRHTNVGKPITLTVVLFLVGISMVMLTPPKEHINLLIEHHKEKQ